MIKNYVISGDISETVISQDKYVFFFKDSDINPGQNLTVTLTVNYDGSGGIASVTKFVEIPMPSKCKI